MGKSSSICCPGPGDIWMAATTELTSSRLLMGGPGLRQDKSLGSGKCPLSDTQGGGRAVPPEQPHVTHPFPKMTCIVCPD